MTSCECTLAGFCARHRVDKTNHLRHLCETNSDYFEAWELGRGPGQLSSEQDKSKRKVIRKRRLIIRDKYRSLWNQLFNEVHTVAQLRDWEKGIPSFGCDCNRFYQCWIKVNPPVVVDFEWKWRLKSAVNHKLGKDNLELDEARAVLGAPSDFVNPKRDNIVAVTSLSPRLHSLEKQQTSIKSWIQFGLKVFARNTGNEIEQLRPHFPDVTWIVDEQRCDGFAYPTQRIRNLARTAIELDKPVLVINSDCSLRGAGEWLEFDEKRQFVGIRWNYEPGIPEVVSEFRWGLDAFSFTPGQAALLPESFPFAIGHPMWDYAVPALMQSQGVELNIVHRPLIYHENHVQNWIKQDWFRGQRWVRENLGVQIEYSSPVFRDSLDPGYRYSQTRWVATG
jgi:hypothetical protein